MSDSSHVLQMFGHLGLILLVLGVVSTFIWSRYE